MNSQSNQDSPPRSITLPLGVIVERRPGVTRWQSIVIAAHSVFIADWTMSSEPREVYRDGPRLRYLAGIMTLELHRKETGDYITNLQSDPPRIYVGLRDNGDQTDFRWRPFLVTAAPYEAEGYMHGGDEVVAAVTMPIELIDATARFVDAHHAEEPFKKRQRVKYFDPEYTPFARPPGWRETDT